MQQRVTIGGGVIAALCVAGFTACAGGPVALLSNGGFEWDDWEWRSVWGHPRHEVVREEAHSGGKSMYFSGAGAITSARFDYRGGPVKVSGWHRLRDVRAGERSYYKFWITVNLFNAEGKGFRHVDVCMADGTSGWGAFEQTFEVLPAETRQIQLSVALHNCTGEAWVDDLQMEADAALPWPTWKFAEEPYYTGTILPNPREVRYADPVAICDGTSGRATLRVLLSPAPCRGARFGADQIRWRLAKCERFVRFHRPDCGAPRPVAVHLGRLRAPHVRAAAKRLGIKLPRPPAQGHVVRTVVGEGGIDVIAAGPDDMGVAYAAASIAQMIGFEDDTLVLKTFELEDRPDFLLRASSDYMPIPDNLLSLLALNKMSMYAIQHRAWWRIVGPEAYAAPRKGHSYEKLIGRMHDFVRRTGAIDLMMLIHIYVASGRPTELTGPVFDIAADADVADLTRRLLWLYENGIRCQMICVDDYTDRRNGRYVCKTAEEEARFGSVGRAHGHLMKRLWEALSPPCPELKLSLVAAPYSMSHMDGTITRESGVQYLRELAKEMPNAVAVVWTGPRITSPKITRRDWRGYAALVQGQPLYLWDNCQGGMPVPGYFVEWYDRIHRDSAWSLMYQNSHFVGWPHTLAAALAANDLMWDVREFDADRVHQAACLKAIGPLDYADVRRVNDGYRSARALVKEANPDLDRLTSLVDETYAALGRLEAVGLPGSVPRRQLSSASVSRDVVSRFHAIPLARVPRLAAGPTLDGQLDDAVWRQAVALTPFAHYQDTPAKKSDQKLFPTECRLGYTGDALYIACVCRHGDVPLHKHEHVGKRDGAIFFNSDTIEVFIGHKTTRAEYVHLAVDHTRTVFDERRPQDGANWNGAWDAAVSKEEGAWRLEMRIPFATLGSAPPRPGDRWRANVCRAFGQKGELSCWAPIYGSFHNWPFFGHLQFE